MGTVVLKKTGQLDPRLVAPRVWLAKVLLAVVKVAAKWVRIDDGEQVMVFLSASNGHALR